MTLLIVHLVLLALFGPPAIMALLHAVHVNRAAPEKVTAADRQFADELFGRR